MPKGIKGFQKNNVWGKMAGRTHGYKKNHKPYNKGLPSEQQPNFKDGRYKNKTK